MNFMSAMEEMYRKIGISAEAIRLGEKAEKACAAHFAEIDRIAEYNQIKVLNAFRECRVGEAWFAPSTGYGYNDLGRDGLEELYAHVFGTEDALVRAQLVSGTHALSIALSGNLRPGDEILSPVGKPYDTLDEVIGIRPQRGSLAEYGVTYRQVDLLPDGSFDFDGIREADVICMVDNCYGEFVEITEPTDVGADMIVGSLIKNPGGGLAPIGGYIAGTEECVANAAYRLTAPGLGKELGASLGVTRQLLQGLFLAPAVTASAEKAAVFAAQIYQDLGFHVVPRAEETRHDIIQSVDLMTPEALSAFCLGIQAAAPVDSFVTPEPWDMPGYDDPVIMAAGAFVSGASIELSADGPMRPPYTAFFQGGLTFSSAKAGVLMSVQKLIDASIIKG